MPSETVSFTLNGTSVGSAITNASGVATLSASASPASTPARTRPASAPRSRVTARFDPSSGSGSLTVSKADQAITVTTHAPASAVFNTSFARRGDRRRLGQPGHLLERGACSNTGATFTMTSGTGTCSVKYDQAGNANYNAAPQVDRVGQRRRRRTRRST